VIYRGDPHPWPQWALPSHLHIIATSGGWDRKASQWEHLDYLPYAMLRKKWQWYLLTMLRQTVKTQEMKRLVDMCTRAIARAL